MSEEIKKKTFEDMIHVIDEEIGKRRGRWKLKAIPSIDFSDVAQIIRLHIWKKFDQWDQARPLEPWLNRIITRQIYNLLRNWYGNFARPCLGCAANQGGDLCAIVGKQCSLCPIYAHWEKHKKSAYDTKLPLPIEGREQQVFSIPEEPEDLMKEVEELHKRMKEILTPLQYRFYDLAYIQGKSEDEIAQLMGYKTNEKNRKAGYKQYPNMRKLIIEKAKKIIEKGL